LTSKAMKTRVLTIFGAVFYSFHVIVLAFMEFELKHFEPLVKNDTKYVNFDNIRVKKVNKTHHLVVGDFEVFQDVTNDFKVSGAVYKAAGNDYKLLPYRMLPEGYCDFLKSQAYVYQDFLPVSDYPPVETVSSHSCHSR
jgi:hypothetical protein